MSCTCPNGGRNGHDIDCDEYSTRGFKEKPAPIAKPPLAPPEICIACGHFPYDPRQNCRCKCHRS